MPIFQALGIRVNVRNGPSQIIASVCMTTRASLAAKHHTLVYLRHFFMSPQNMDNISKRLLLRPQKYILRCRKKYNVLFFKMSSTIQLELHFQKTCRNVQRKFTSKWHKPVSMSCKMQNLVTLELFRRISESHFQVNETKKKTAVVIALKSIALKINKYSFALLLCLLLFSIQNICLPWAIS